MSNWIPYKLRDKVTLPCWVYHPKQGVSASFESYNNGSPMSDGFNFAEDKEITHWMPMIKTPPLPPSEHLEQPANDKHQTASNQMGEEFNQWKAEKQTRPTLPEVTTRMIVDWACEYDSEKLFQSIAMGFNKWIKENFKV